MSAQAYSWACRQTGMRPGAKLLLAMVANHADKSGVAFPGRKTLSDECCYRPASVTDNMAQLVEGGWLARLERRRANGSKTSDWLVLAPTSPDRGEMTDADPSEYPEEVAALALRGSGSVSVPKPEGAGSVSSPGQVRFWGGPETSVEPLPLSENGLEAEPEISSLGSLDAPLVARKQDSAEIVSGEVVEIAPPPTKLFGKPAPAPLVRDAVAALNCYCEQTGQQIRPYTARGKPSDSLTRIMRAMADHPEIQVIYRRMIEHTLISRWWGHDDPHVGVIFGPGVVQQSIQRAHRRPSPGTNGRLTPSGEALRALRLADTSAIG